MNTSRTLSLVTFIFAAMAGVVVMAAEDQESGNEKKKTVVIDLNINGEKFHITSLDDLKKHADRLKDHLDLDELMEAFDGVAPKVRIRRIEKDKDKSHQNNLDVEVRKELFINRDGDITELKGTNVWVEADPDEQEKLGAYMIGLACKDADETLLSHLRIEGAALVVIETVPESPAENAGFQTHDVLVKADGETIGKLNQLVTAVEAAGTDERELSIELIRQGKHRVLKVTPAKRPKSQAWRVELHEDAEQAADSHNSHDHEHDVNVVVELEDQASNSHRDLREMVEALRVEVEKLRKEIKEKN